MSAFRPIAYTWDEAKEGQARDAGYTARALLRTVTDILSAADGAVTSAGRYGREAGSHLQPMCNVEADRARERIRLILAELDETFPSIPAESVALLQAAE